MRSNNTQLKRKLNTVESRVKRDSSKYKKQRDDWENDRVSSGSKRKQGDKEGDKPHDEGHTITATIQWASTELDMQMREVETAKDTDKRHACNNYK